MIVLYCLFFSCNKTNNNTLRIACASSIRPFLESVIPIFKEKTNITVQVISGSSGKLSSQIINGAPFDIFISANKKFPEFVIEKLKLKNKTQFLANGELVFLSKFYISNDFLGLENKNIGIASPELAPYGRAAFQVIERKEITSRIIFGENISQVNQYLRSGAVDCIFTAKSSIKNTNLEKDFYVKEISPQLHKPIENSYLLLTGKKQVVDFINFLQTEEIKTILESYGYFVTK